VQQAMCKTGQIFKGRLDICANPQTHTYSSHREPDMIKEDKKFPTKKKLTGNGM